MIGFFWGFVSGDYATCLGVSLFFELLWLDIFPAGTIIPPQSLAPTLASLAVVHHLGITRPSLAVLVMFAALPLGQLFAQLERYHRQYENRAHGSLLAWAETTGRGMGPAALTRRSILVMLPVNMVFFAAALFVLTALSAVLIPRLSPFLEPIPLAWPHLWVVASIGAVLALRHKPAYTILAGGSALALLSRFVA